MRCVAWLSRALIVITVVSLGACTAEHAANPTTAVDVGWRHVDLPTDPRGRDMVRAVAACNGRWYVSGAILTTDGQTSPALWVSDDGESFASVPTRPVSAYGPSDVLYSVACDGDNVVAVGAQIGGAHGNPRTSTWVAQRGGPLVEVHAPFELFGGPNAGFVGQVAAGPAGFLIVGLRLDAHGGPGAAVWHSGIGSAFTLVDADPALESDARGLTEAHAATVTADGFVAVGGITPPGSRAAARDPLVWRSPNGGTWQRVALPPTPSDDVMLQVTPVSGGLVAIGTDGRRFRWWSADADGENWHASGVFGNLGSPAAVPTVSSAVGDGSTVYAVVANASRYELWRGGVGTRWQPVTLPVAVPSAPVRTGPRVAAAAGNAGTLMLATDDGQHAAVWFAKVG